jgi:O-antigen/teichoic acid export membrane protein
LRLSRRLLLTTPSVFVGVTRASAIAAAKKYRHFPLFSSWAGVLSGSANVGNVIFTVIYGATVGGFVFLGDRIMLQPLRVSGNAFLQVFVGEAGRILDESPAAFRQLFVGVVGKQAALSVAWLGLIYLAAHFAIPVVFGRAWADASRYIDVMLFGYLPTAIAIPASHTLLLMKKQRLSAALDAVRFVALIVVIVAATNRGAAPITAVLAYSVTQGVAQTLILAVMYVEVSRRAAPPATRTSA